MSFLFGPSPQAPRQSSLATRAAPQPQRARSSVIRRAAEEPGGKLGERRNSPSFDGRDQFLVRKPPRTGDENVRNPELEPPPNRKKRVFNDKFPSPRDEPASPKSDERYRANKKLVRKVARGEALSAEEQQAWSRLRKGPTGNDQWWDDMNRRWNERRSITGNEGTV